MLNTKLIKLFEAAVLYINERGWTRARKSAYRKLRKALDKGDILGACWWLQMVWASDIKPELTPFRDALYAVMTPEQWDLIYDMLARKIPPPK